MSCHARRYATSLNGVDITEHSCLIHDFYGTECATPVHLVLDTALTDDKLSVKAFVSTPLSLADRALASQFQQIPVEVVFEEHEAIAGTTASACFAILFCLHLLVPSLTRLVLSSS